MQSNKHVGRVTGTPKFEQVGNQENPIAKITIGLAIERNTRKNAPTDFLYYTALDKRAEVLNSLGIDKGTVMEIDFIQESFSFTRADGKRGYGTQNSIQSFHIWSPKKQSTNQTDPGNFTGNQYPFPSNEEPPAEMNNPFGIPGFDSNHLQ